LERGRGGSRDSRREWSALGASRNRAQHPGMSESGWLLPRPPLRPPSSSSVSWKAIATLSSPEAADQKARLHRLERPSSVRQQESGATFRVSSMAHSGDLPERLYFVNGHTFSPPLISGSHLAQSSLYIFLTIFSWKYRPNSQIRAWLSESSPEFLPQVDSESATLVFRL
jgi:hypothetical protein